MPIFTKDEVTVLLSEKDDISLLVSPADKKIKRKIEKVIADISPNAKTEALEDYQCRYMKTRLNAHVCNGMKWNVFFEEKVKHWLDIIPSEIELTKRKVIEEDGVHHSILVERLRNDLALPANYADVILIENALDLVLLR